MQIADRFHLHQNLMDAVYKVLNREIPQATAVTSEENAKNTPAENQEGIACKKNEIYCG